MCIAIAMQSMTRIWSLDAFCLICDVLNVTRQIGFSFHLAYPSSQRREHTFAR